MAVSGAPLSLPPTLPPKSVFMRVASPWVWFTHEQALPFRETPWRLKTREPASPVCAAGLRGGPGSGPRYSAKQNCPMELPEM